jgi:Ala-tRNA(Pro) deacylase
VSNPCRAAAPSFVDLNRLRDIAGAGDVRLASECELERLYPDCEVGAVPPLGPLYGLPVFVDRALAATSEIVFDAGSHSDAIKVKYDDFARAVRPTVGDFGQARRASIGA